ncbi:bifunctional metallophosphatase/5'-nucleotidase [Breznakiella homolactica]|uniref:5'-nucleotidase C-terminal domain-containing protein n=1 Tax=Breznakiella homolactica TaxID=2798577 RepID=A0A7T7XKU5_9SPIR|nr:5'-nucleotidase C-terminal domain-containing protein [Breznakiella homolactica]QQO08112.1 5'-nucleotidase C-terminal domain-containing protein [Breznakiella homolactica]
MIQGIKKYVALSAILGAVFFVAACSTAQGAADIPEGTKVSFQILFTSDTHGSFTNYNYATGRETVGGLTKAASIISREKAGFPGPTLVIDVGDTIQGNGTSYFINNKDFIPYPNVAAFEVIGYDAATLGNHEFNFGIEAMYQAFDGFTGEKLMANVTYNDGSYLKGFQPYHVFTMPQGLRVAVIGVVTPNIERWDQGNMRKDGLRAESASQAVRRTIDEIKRKNLADIFVLAAHMSTENEYGTEGSGALDVANMNPELAVIMGAHFHTIRGTQDKQVVLGNPGVKYAENKNAAASVGKVIITAVYENGQWVIPNKTGDYAGSGVQTDIISVTADTPQDPQVAAAVAKAHETVRRYVSETVVGYLTGGPLVPEPEIKGSYEGYLRDTALADLVNKVMMHFTGAEIAGGAPLDTNSNHQPGQITIAGVATIYKYDNNTLYKLRMTGDQVIKWMEYSYSYFTPTVNGTADHTKPAFNPATDLTISTGAIRDYNQDQFSGIKYEVDLTKPVGQRIRVLSMADGSPFSLTKEYIIACNDYRASTQLLNTSETGVFKPGEKIAQLIEADVQSPSGLTSMPDLIIEYIRMQPNQTITNDCDNNWRFVNLNWDPALRAKAVEAINSGRITTDFKSPVTKAQVEALR